MKKLLPLGIVAALALATAAYAYPTLQGPTGLVNAPNAVVAPSNTVSLALDWYNTKDTAGKDMIPVRALVGFLDNFEAGVSYNNAGPIGVSYGINAKYVYPEAFSGFKVGAGLGYAQGDKFAGNTGTMTDLYLVTTTPIPTQSEAFTVDGTLGLQWTQVKATKTADALQPFIGFNSDITIGEKKLGLALDYIIDAPKIGANKGAFGFAARYDVIKNLTVQVGVDNNTYQNGDAKFKPFLGLNYAYSWAGDDEDETPAPAKTPAKK